MLREVPRRGRQRHEVGEDIKLSALEPLVPVDLEKHLQLHSRARERGRLFLQTRRGDSTIDVRGASLDPPASRMSTREGGASDAGSLGSAWAEEERGAKRRLVRDTAETVVQQLDRAPTRQRSFCSLGPLPRPRRVDIPR